MMCATLILAADPQASEPTDVSVHPIKNIVGCSFFVSVQRGGVVHRTDNRGGNRILPLRGSSP